QTPAPIFPEDVKGIKLILKCHFHDHTAREYTTEIPWVKFRDAFVKKVCLRAAVMRTARDMPGNKPYYEKLKNELKRIETLGEEAAGQELERIVAQDETENQVEVEERVVVDEPDL
ncbi:hypothetical protein HDU79_007640, partial [Rhizoclosmatium sp. JEL0117]